MASLGRCSPSSLAREAKLHIPEVGSWPHIPANSSEISVKHPSIASGKVLKGHVQGAEPQATMSKALSWDLEGIGVATALIP